MDNSWKHTTVLLNEAVDALFTNPETESNELSITEPVYVDATFGRGGHSRLILSKLSPQGRLIAFDKDGDAVTEAATIRDPPFLHQASRVFSPWRVGAVKRDGGVARSGHQLASDRQPGARIQFQVRGAFGYAHGHQSGPERGAMVGNGRDNSNSGGDT